MKIAFVAMGANMQWASARLRCLWPAAYMGADVLRAEYIGEHPHDMPIDYDVYIIEKVGIPVFQRRVLEAGKQVWWDVCDPTWWWVPEEVRDILTCTTGQVASCAALADDLATWGNCKVHTIPDRMELKQYPERRIHRESDPVRFIWYGASQNRIAILGGLSYLERLICDGYNVELTIFDDHPEQKWLFSDRIPLYYTQWSLEKENMILSGHDIAFLPPYPGAWGRVKSNNKKLTAWANGLAVTDAQDYDELVKLVANVEERKANAAAGYDDLIKNWTVEKNAQEWMRLIDENLHTA